MTTTIIVGGSGGLGQHLAAHCVARGDTVIVTSRDLDRAKAAAERIGGGTTGLAVDLARPDTIAAALADITDVDHLVITAIEQAVNSIAHFDIENAVRSSTVKLVGYPETVRALRDRFRPGGSVVLFGGVAKDVPYPGSTMVTATNAAVSGLVRTLAREVAPIRVNAVHPGFVGDSPKWAGSTTPCPPNLIDRAVTMAEVTMATDFLLTNQGIDAIDLYVDGGQRLGAPA